MKARLIELLNELLRYEDKKEGKKIGKEIFKILSEAFDLQISERKNIKTAYSTALNAYDSAYCVAYPLRTKKNLKATINVLKKIEGKNVLYIGTGPFAPYFLFPLLLGCSCKFTLLEINPYAINILKKLIEIFELEDFVLEVVEADATIWKAEKHYEVVLCETSDVGLRREDTLPIYINLKEQLPDAVFVPKDVIILGGSGVTKEVYEFDSLSEAIKRKELKMELPFTLDKAPFIQNKIILDDEFTIEPYESIVTMPLYVKK